MPIVGTDVFNVVLDPAEVAIEREQIFLNAGDYGIDVAGIDWGDAAITAFMADMQVGSVPADSRVPNRLVSIPLFLGAHPLHGVDEFEEARRDLQKKVGVIQSRHRGWLKRGDTGLYADVVNATLTQPDKTGETHGIEEGVRLVLECKPDFYGDEIELDLVTFAGDPSAWTGALQGPLLLDGEPALIEGDMDGRVRIVLSDAPADEGSLLWHVRNWDFDPDESTSSASYFCKDMVPLDSASVVGNRIEHNSLPVSQWTPVLLTDLVSVGPLTHTGSYRVWVRANSPNAAPSLRLLYGVGGVSNPEINDPVMLPGTNADYLVSLGDIRVDAPPVGVFAWQGVIQAFSADATSGPAQIQLDRIYFQSLGEYAGYASADPSPTPVFGIEQTSVAGAAVQDASNGGVLVWGPPVYPTGETQILGTGGGQLSEYLKTSNFGLSVPVGATVTGIEVRITRAGHSDFVSDVEVRLAKGAVIQPANRAIAGPWSSSMGPVIYGSPTDLWGTTWTPAEVNASTFSVLLSVEARSWGLIDEIAVIVFYSTAGGFASVTDAALFETGVTEIRTEGVYRLISGSSTVYGRMSTEHGNLPRIPPSGMEGRQVEVMAKVMRGPSLDAAPEFQSDPTIDPFSMQVFYRPCYLFRN